MATISLLGLYNYNNDIFRGLQLPESVDKETLVNNLLAECAEFEILYPDADFLAFMIEVWSKKELPVWQKLSDTLYFDYDPISNYDRTEEWTDENATQGQNSESGTSKNNESGTSSNSANSNGTNIGVDTKGVAGYNGDIATSERTNADLETTVNSEASGETVRNSSGEVSHESTTQTSATNKRSGRAYGNIGVTTTQQMIEEERRVVKFNIADYIIDSFKRRFCLLIY